MEQKNKKISKLYSYSFREPKLVLAKKKSEPKLVAHARLVQKHNNFILSETKRKPPIFQLQIMVETITRTFSPEICARIPIAYNHTPF